MAAKFPQVSDVATEQKMVMDGIAIPLQLLLLDQDVLAEGHEINLIDFDSVTRILASFNNS